MKKFVCILGGQASGKMTIGEELSKITGLKLFHNHMTVDFANHFYGFDIIHKESFSSMIDDIRKIVFSNVAKSLIEGIIFTAVMCFDEEENYLIILEYSDIFSKVAKENGQDAEVFYVELVCDINERRKRNITENRLEKKPTKRNIEWSKNDLDETDKNHRINSNEEDIKRFNANNYFKIDNTNLSAKEVALKIKERFNL